MCLMKWIYLIVDLFGFVVCLLLDVIKCLSNNACNYTVE